MTRTLTSLLLCVAVGLGIGTAWFKVNSPFRPLDVNFYFTLYLTIGAIAGFFAWFIAALVHNGRVRLGPALAVLAIPFVLIFTLSLDKNPRTAFVVIVLFALAVIPSFVAKR